MFCRQRPEVRVLMIGLNASGKTRLLYLMKLGEVVTTIPTIGFNVESVQSASHLEEYTVWDVGGQDKIRPLWRHYFQNTQVLAFCVNASEPSRYPEAKEELMKIVRESELANTHLLIVVTTIDGTVPAPDADDTVIAAVLPDECPMEFSVARVELSSSDGVQPMLRALAEVSGGKIVLQRVPDPEADEEVSTLFLRRVASIIAPDQDLTVNPNPFMIGDSQQLPSEVIALVLEYMNLTDLIPSPTFQCKSLHGCPISTRNGCNVWAVNKSLMHACMLEATRRVTVAHAAAPLQTRSSHSNNEGHIFHAFFRPMLFWDSLGLPDTAPLHVGLVASLLLSLVFGKGDGGNAADLVGLPFTKFLLPLPATDGVKAMYGLLPVVVAREMMERVLLDADSDASLDIQGNSSGGHLNLIQGMLRCFARDGSRNEEIMMFALFKEVMVHLGDAIGTALLHVTAPVKKLSIVDFPFMADVGFSALAEFIRTGKFEQLDIISGTHGSTGSLPHVLLDAVVHLMVNPPTTNRCRAIKVTSTVSSASMARILEAAPFAHQCFESLAVHFPTADCIMPRTAEDLNRRWDTSKWTTMGMAVLASHV